MNQRIIETIEDINTIKREAQAKVKTYVDLANVLLKTHMPYPKVMFDLKGTTAGTAGFNVRNPSKSLIRFSSTLLIENVDDFLNRTVGHEVAHLIARLQYGASIDPHGTEWARVMYAFRLPPTRCHNYDTTNVQNNGQRARKVLPSIKTELGTVHMKSIGRVIDFD